MFILTAKMRYLFIFLFAFSISCRHQTVDVENVYNSLEDGQSKVIIKIDTSNFYKVDAIFKGQYQLTDKVFNLNIMDQYGSNLMGHGYEENWAKKNPPKFKGILVGNYASTLMIGKVVDKKKNIGAGYLMSDGYIKFKDLSKEKIVIEINGKLKKYPNVGPEDSTYTVSGYIISKNPVLSDSDLF